MARAMMSAILVLLMSLNVSAASALPDYRIVSEDGDKAALRVSVRLEARQTEADLQAISEDVRQRLPTGKVVSAVLFFLPATPLTEKAWAEVRLTLEPPAVTITGLRLDEEDAYRAEAASDTRARVGVWLTSPPALTGRLTIYRDKKGQPFAEWRMRNGQTTTDALHEVRSNRGRRFVIADSDGGYYQPGANGTLELGAQGRRIAVAEPLKIQSTALAERPPVRALPPPSVTEAGAQNANQSAVQELPLTAHAPAFAEDAVPAAVKPVIRRAPTARKKPAVRHADATAHDAISRALAQ